MMTPEQIAAAMPQIEAHVRAHLLPFPVMLIGTTKKPAERGWQSKVWDLGMLRLALEHPQVIGYGLTLPRDDPRRLIVMDLDDGAEPAPGQATWRERLAAIEAQYGPLPITKTTRTPGGEHRWFDWPQGIDLPKGSWHGFTVRSLHGAKNYVMGPGSVRRDGIYVDALPGARVAMMPVELARSGRAARYTNGHAGEAGAINPGERHHWLRDRARHYAGVIRDPEVLRAAVLAENAKLALPKRPEEVDRAIGDVLLKFGPDEEPVREPVKASNADWPDPLGESAYHGLAGVLVNSVAPYTEADPVGLLGTFLTIFGTVAGNGWSLHQGDWQHTNLFVALVGDTSVSRKGTTFGINREIFELAGGWHSILVPGLGSGEGLIEYLKKNADDPRALVFETEFSRFLTAMTRDGSTLSPVVRNAWDGVPIGRHVANQKQSGTVYQHHVGVLANITNVELAQRLTSVDAANGFGNRFLWLAVRRPQLLPFTEPVKRHVSPFIGSLHAALEFAGGSGYLQLSEAARQRWEAFYRGRPSRAGLIGALTSRAEPYVARLAMVYALLDRSRAIEVEHLAAAEAVWDYAERSAIYIFGDSTGNRDADALLRLLQEQSPFPWDQAKREIGIRTSAEMEMVVGLLERLDRVRLTRVKRAGRARREIELMQ